jgi:hypothetical protein
MVFVRGTCGSIHVESFNRNMKLMMIVLLLFLQKQNLANHLESLKASSDNGDPIYGINRR